MPCIFDGDFYCKFVDKFPLVHWIMTDYLRSFVLLSTKYTSMIMTGCIGMQEKQAPL